MEAKPNRRARNRHCIGRNARTLEVVMTRLPLRVSTSLMAMWNLFNACAGSVAAGAVAAAVFRNSLRGRIMATSFLAGHRHQESSVSVQRSTLLVTLIEVDAAWIVCASRECRFP